MSRPELALEQKVLRAYQSLSKPPKRLLLALSGGLDSVVMAEILWRWRQGLKVELAVAHIHHGPAETTTQEHYRKSAQRYARAWSEERGLKFYTNAQAPTQTLSSEQEWRDWRELHLREWVKDQDAVVMAHHQDDLLETRLIRLIRGSGSQGLRAMSAFSPGRWRPLLAVSRKEISAYAKVRNLTWVEDPSNQKNKALRNWLRRDWLPALEGKRPGALSALASSLENLVPEKMDFDLAPFVGLRRELLSGCSVSERRELLARYLNALGLKGYGKSHVNEILKHLDRLNSQDRSATQAEFSMLGMTFKISPDFLWASRV